MAKIKRPLTWLSAGTRAALARKASTSRDGERSLGRLFLGMANLPAGAVSLLPHPRTLSKLRELAKINKLPGGGRSHPRTGLRPDFPGCANLAGNFSKLAPLR